MSVKLKIKDNVDLKKLEKFGFKQKYNEDTGKAEKYIKDNKGTTITIYNEVKEILIDICFFPPEASQEDFIEFGTLLYDLIKADLVEKVEEE